MSDFRYERLMEVKDKLLQHKQRELEAASVAVQTIVEEIAKIGQESTNTYSELTGRCLTGKEVSVLIGYITYLDKQKVVLSEEKKRREGYVESLRRELLNLEIELKMLEKLKTKTLQTIKKAANKKEQKLMDELALRTEGQ
jgi:flagellar export protein FliJ